MNEWCAYVLQSIEREEPIEVDPAPAPFKLANGHTSTAGNGQLLYLGNGQLLYQSDIIVIINHKCL